jgi:hypothetical protein
MWWTMNQRGDRKRGETADHSTSSGVREHQAVVDEAGLRPADPTKPLVCAQDCEIAAWGLTSKFSGGRRPSRCNAQLGS